MDENYLPLILHTNDQSTDLAERTKFYSQFAKEAYAAGNYGEIEGWSVDPKHSNINRTLWYNNANKDEAILAFRGTNIKNKNDLGTNVLYATGLKKHSSRFQNAEKYTRLAMQDYPSLALTGHSLGGGQALYAAKNVEGIKETWAFSPHIDSISNLTRPTSGFLQKMFDISFRLGKKTNTPKNVHAVTTVFDPVAAHLTMNYPDAQVSYVRMKPGVWNPHSLEHFGAH